MASRLIRAEEWGPNQSFESARKSVILRLYPRPPKGQHLIYENEITVHIITAVEPTSHSEFSWQSFASWLVNAAEGNTLLESLTQKPLLKARTSRNRHCENATSTKREKYQQWIAGHRSHTPEAARA